MANKKRSLRIPAHLRLYLYTMRNVSILFISLLLFSCNNDKNINYIIDEAESIVSHNPDSAISILLNVPNPEKLTDPTKVKYWLSMGQAHYNSGKSMVEDSQLFFCIDYYISQEDNDKNITKLLQAYKLTAQHLWWNNKNQEAFDLLDKGLDLSKHYNDTISSIHLLKSMANLSKEIYKVDDNIKYTKQLLEIDNKAPDLYNYYNDLGIMYYYAQEKDSSVYYLEKALFNVNTSDSLLIWSNLARNYADILSDFGDQTKAIQIQQKVLDYYLNHDSKYVSLSYISLSRYYLNKGEKKDASRYMQLAENTYHPFIDEDLSLINYYTVQKSLLDYVNTQTFKIKDVVYLSNKIFEDILNQEKIILSKNDKQRNLEYRNLQLSIEKQKNQMIIIVISLVAIILILLVTFSLKQRKKMLEEKEEELETFKKMLSEAQKSNNKDDKFFKKILLQQLGLIKIVATTPTSHNQELLMQMARITNRDIPIEDILNWNDLYLVIDSIYDNFHTKINELYGDVLLEKEVQLCCLLKAEFSTKEISTVTQQSIRTIYQRKSTIRAKLNMQEKEDIIEFVLEQIQRKNIE